MVKFYTLILFLTACVTWSNAQVIKGLVSDPTGQPVPFAKIRIQSTSHGTFANGKGEYQLEVEKQGTYPLQFSYPGYTSFIDTVRVEAEVLFYNVTMTEEVMEIEEVKVLATSKKAKGRELMKKVIDKRRDFYNATKRYSCETYCFASLDKTQKVKSDTLPDSLKIDKAKMNITEWKGISYYQARDSYKDEIIAFTDHTDKGKNTASVEITFSDEELGESTGSIETNPYVFVNGIEDADLNIFKNSIDAPSISQRPIISPLAYNAFMYYQFFLERSFYEDGEKIYEIRVKPIFKEEALFYGTLFIRDSSYAPASYELGINKGAMTYFKEMRIITQYESNEGKVLPTKREFIYLIKEGRSTINGKILVAHDDYKFEYDDSKRNFWLETQTYSDDAFDRDTSYWQSVRPFHLKPEEREFIHTQDSIAAYLMSEEYLKKEDSIYNSLTVWDFIFNGVGFRNTFKKREFWVAGLIEQVIPFGVGGYRHMLHGYYEKEFENAMALDIEPRIDYGFKNADLKGSLGVGFMYNPRRFGRVFMRFGDTYDFINEYESIQGTLGPANRVRNQKLEINHRFEVFNGLYMGAGITYSTRSSIDSIEYPKWVKYFGDFAQASPFEQYDIFVTELELSYKFRQKYIIKNNKKIVLGSKWPTLFLTYKKGYPNVLGGQSDFDFLEFRIKDRIEMKALGATEYRVTAGSFLRKNDLRVIEHKYFRTSDLFFFSDPTKSMQMLDTSLNTSKSYLQANFIHHFNGFFLNKVWGLNKLGLEETVGGGLLMIPEAGFNQVEFYVGLERLFRIRKQLFKIGFYAVASDNNFDKASIRYKFGVNFYDSFRKKWDY